MVADFNQRYDPPPPTDTPWTLPVYPTATPAPVGSPGSPSGYGYSASSPSPQSPSQSESPSAKALRGDPSGPALQLRCMVRFAGPQVDLGGGGELYDSPKLRSLGANQRLDQLRLHATVVDLTQLHEQRVQRRRSVDSGSSGGGGCGGSSGGGDGGSGARLSDVGKKLFYDDSPTTGRLHDGTEDKKKQEEEDNGKDVLNGEEDEDEEDLLFVAVQVVSSTCGTYRLGFTLVAGEPAAARSPVLRGSSLIGSSTRDRFGASIAAEPQPEIIGAETVLVVEPSFFCLKPPPLQQQPQQQPLPQQQQQQQQQQHASTPSSASATAAISMASASPNVTQAGVAPGAPWWSQPGVSPAVQHRGHDDDDDDGDDGDDDRSRGAFRGRIVNDDTGIASTRCVGVVTAVAAARRATTQRIYAAKWGLTGTLPFCTAGLYLCWRCVLLVVDVVVVVLLPCFFWQASPHCSLWPRAVRSGCGIRHHGSGSSSSRVRRQRECAFAALHGPGADGWTRTRLAPAGTKA
jgi:hypothetical protein